MLFLSVIFGFFGEIKFNKCCQTIKLDSEGRTASYIIIYVQEIKHIISFWNKTNDA